MDATKYTLDNGLRIAVHTDTSTPMAAVNLLYDVGAKDEHPERTGFAHLFEHLMFGGSDNIPSFDEPLQRAGGENNAFTNNDFTNYYITLPAQNIETAFWLESDRMLRLAFSERSLEVQRSVVIEEFNQNYLNRPYGDMWMLLRQLAYKQHPYRWCTIGISPEHIRHATLAEVEDFFYSHYAPNNAILTVAGPLQPDRVLELAQRWFGPIARRNVHPRRLPAEPQQTAPRELEAQRDVPFNALMMAYHMPNRTHPDFYTADLITDALSGGKSGRLYQRLVKEQQLFSGINCFVTGDIDSGLLVVQGQLFPNTSFESAERAIAHELEQLAQCPLPHHELQKLHNRYEANSKFEEINVLNKAMNLAFYELIGSALDINHEVERYRAVDAQRVLHLASSMLQPSNRSTLRYIASKQ
ncbi:MAG: insulinase family protein [Bacteroidales bacterium]|nr:insulinase family protein [Bacteroidales bacterium]